VKASVAVQVASAHQFMAIPFSSNQVFTLFAHPRNAGDARFICATASGSTPLLLFSPTAFLPEHSRRLSSSCL